MEWFFVILATIIIAQIVGGLLPWIALKRFKRHIRGMMLTEILIMIFLSIELMYVGFMTSYLALIGVVVGMFMIILLDDFIHHRHEAPDKEMSHLLFIAMCIHELPEGIAFGSSYILGGGVGFLTSFLMGLHNIPEGSVVSFPLLIKKKFRKAIELLGITQLIFGVGALFSFLFLISMDGRIQAVLMCFAAGAMLFISAKELKELKMI